MRKPRQILVFLLTAGGSLSLTLGAWYSARSDADAEARGQFDVQVTEIVAAIKGRALDYEQVLRGAAGLFAASASVERSEWDSYVDALRLETVYPGIRGIGYAPFVRDAERAALEKRAALEAIEGFAISPPGTREAYVPVLFIRPLDEANRRAIGRDLYADPARRQALERARDTGTAAITRALTLFQSADGSSERGAIMYLPVYRNGAEVESVAERRAALAGFVNVPFRYADAATGVGGVAPGFDLRIFDVTDGVEPEELFRTSSAEARAGGGRFTRSVAFRVAQRAWRLDAASLPALEAEIGSKRPALVLASGLAISALLLLVVWSLATTRERARELAGHMTVALRASEERLQLALASSQLALFDWDVPAGLVQLSAEWSVMLGGPAEPTLTPIQKLQSLDHPEDAATVLAKVGALTRGESDSLRYEHRIRRQDGSWLWIETTARVNQRAPDGSALRVTGANANIEERKAVERMKNEFIATVNHELRTPLTSMLGSLGLVREGSAGALPPAAGKFIDIAYENSERLVALVNDILDIERIETGRLPMRVETVELGPLLQRAIELNDAYAARFGVRLVLAPDAAAAPVRADPDRLMQVLANLLSNASKYSPQGGEVALAAVPAGERVRVSVADQGPGVPAEFRPRLFGRFEQADGAQAGTGLGLAISKAIVERMGGRIGCDSEPGRGATFWFELPRA